MNTKSKVRSFASKLMGLVSRKIGILSCLCVILLFCAALPIRVNAWDEDPDVLQRMEDAIRNATNEVFGSELFTECRTETFEGSGKYYRCYWVDGISTRLLEIWSFEDSWAAENFWFNSTPTDFYDNSHWVGTSYYLHDSRKATTFHDLPATIEKYGSTTNTPAYSHLWWREDRFIFRVYNAYYILTPVLEEMYDYAEALYGAWASVLPNLTYWKASENGSFSITPQSSLEWGDDITIYWCFQNNGKGDIPNGTEIRFGFFLSNNSTISTNDYFLSGGIWKKGLKANHYLYSDREENLPWPPPAGFGDDGIFYIGMILDPYNSIEESIEDDNSNQGLGKDYVSLLVSTAIPETMHITDRTFKSGQTYEIVATQSITIGPRVTVEDGAKVTFRAPTVKIDPGCNFMHGCTLSIDHRSVTSKAPTEKPQHRVHEENDATLKIKQ